MEFDRLSRRQVLAGAAATAALGAFGLAGCSPTNTAATTAPSIGKDTEATINYVFWDDKQKPAIDKIVAAFNKQYPKITVNASVVGAKDYWTKLKTGLQGGGGPDVFWMNGTNFAFYAKNGQLAPYDYDTTIYPKGLVDLYSFGGKTYGAPKDFDTIGVFYNKKLFQAAGVPLPKAGWTWDDYNSAVEKLTKDGVFGVAAAPYGQMTYYNTILAAGGEILSKDGKSVGFDSPEAHKGIQFWLDFINKKQSPTIQQMTDTWPGNSFGSGQIAMFWDGSWGASGYAAAAEGANIDVAPLPVGPGGNNSCVIHGLGNVVNAKSKSLDAAKAFAAFASGKEAAEIQASTGTVIPAVNGYQEKWVKSVPAMNLQVFLDAAKTAIPYPAPTNGDAWGPIEGKIITEILSGKTELAAGLADMTKQLDAILN
ncbi:MAG TPA: sugar ABC transporter substrate-binding protein [Candidatus Lumbricidophila sp.]|nr:sugar ABC transporter substrate-binding protein [Candidatus Lumbricidophila sp.]